MKLSKEEIENLANKFIKLKASGKDSIEFLSFKEEFAKKMEYIIDLYTYRYKRFSNYEDLRQDAFVSLMLALESFDKEKKGSFAWWAKQYVKTKISRSANKHSAFKVPLEEAGDLPPIKVNINDLNSGKEFLLGLVAKDSPEQILIKNNLWSVVRKSFNKLSNRERKIIEYHFSLDDEFANIADLCFSLKLSRFDYSLHLKNAAKKVEADLKLKKSELSNLL